MLVHKEFAARAYSDHMYALTDLVKNLVKKQEQMDWKVFLVKNVVPATITEEVFEIMRAELFGEFWALHSVNARGSGNYRESDCERVFCIKNNCSFKLILVLQNRDNQVTPEISIGILKTEL